MLTPDGVSNQLTAVGAQYQNHLGLISLELLQISVWQSMRPRLATSLEGIADLISTLQHSTNSAGVQTSSSSVP